MGPIHSEVKPHTNPGTSVDTARRAKRTKVAYRIRWIPEVFDSASLATALSASLNIERDAITVHPLAYDAPYGRSTRQKVAVVTFEIKPEIFKVGKQWEVKISIPGGKSNELQDVCFDTVFEGFTPLTPAELESDTHIDCILIHGWAGHPIGSFSSDSDWFWPRDSLCHEIPALRVWLYGYSSELRNSGSIADVHEYADTFRRALADSRRLSDSKVAPRPLIYIVHSLGGWILQDAIAAMTSSEHSDDEINLAMTKGALLFGVPSLGMENQGLISLLQQDNLPAVYTANLLDERYGFRHHITRADTFYDACKRTDVSVYTFYETNKTPTVCRDEATQDWVRNGPELLLVKQSSATYGCPERQNKISWRSNHNDMLKLRKGDMQYETLLSCVRETIQRIETAHSDDLGLPIPSRFSTSMIQSQNVLDSTKIVSLPERAGNAIQTVILEESQGLKAEIGLLRQLLLENPTGGRTLNGVSSLVEPQLELSQISRATNEVGRRLLMSPGTLRAACDESVHSMELNRIAASRKHGRGSDMTSWHTILRQNSTWRIGPFGLNCDSVDTQNLQARQKRSRKTTFRVRLLPILRKTVEISFAANFGAGGNSIAASLRYYGTIERSKSPIFQLIDSFPCRYAQRVYVGQDETSFYSAVIEDSQQVFLDSTIWEETEFCAFVLDWDVDRLEQGILELCQNISNELATDYDAVSHSDENGNTLLHALVVLIGLLGGCVEKFSGHFEVLADRLIAAGVAVNAMGRIVSSEYVASFIGHSSSKVHLLKICGLGEVSTVLGLAVRIALSSQLSEVPLPLPNTMLGILEDEEPIETPTQHVRCGCANVPLNTKIDYLNLFQDYPGLLAYFGYGPFEIAIINRWPNEVKSFLEEEAMRLQILNTNYSGRVTPAEMAVDWPIGMKLLSDAGFDLDSAFLLAIYTEDIETTKVILASEYFPCGTQCWREALCLLKFCQTQEMPSLIISDLTRRRGALANLAMDHLTAHQLTKLGLSTGQILDVSALEVFNELQARDIAIPRTLFLASKFERHHDDTPVDYVPVYFAFLIEHSHIYPNKDLLQLAYDSGFKAIDACQAYYETPLFIVCDSLHNWSKSRVDSVLWLLDNGADTRYQYQDNTPNILFQLARLYGSLLRGYMSLEFIDIENIITRVLAKSQCQPLSTDGCRCECSDNGCSPLNRFWSCHYEYENHEGCENIDTSILLAATKDWIKMCALDEQQAMQYYKQAVMLEAFDRLGMKHTCCQSKYQMKLRSTTLSKEEKARSLKRNALKEQKMLRKENKLFKKQLNLLTQGYLDRYDSHIGTLHSFWEDAMLDLDSLLPHPAPEDRCNGRCLPYSTLRYSWGTFEWDRLEEERHFVTLEVQKARLEERGYGGWDFGDVVRHHFCKSTSLISGNTLSNHLDTSPSARLLPLLDLCFMISTKDNPPGGFDT